MNLPAGHTPSICQDFQNYLRTEFHLTEDDIGFVLYHFDSGFITYEKPSVIHPFEEFYEVFSRDLQIEYDVNPSIIVESDDISTKTFFRIILGFTPH